MEQPRANESVGRLHSRLVYQRAYLAADGRFADLETATAALIERARALRMRQFESREDVVVHLARRKRADVVADGALRSAEADLLAGVARNRGHAGYQLLFGQRPMSVVVRLPLREEALAIRRIADLLDQVDFAALREKHQPLLWQAADELLAADDSLTQALAREALLASELTLFRLDVVRLFNTNYADILKAMPSDRQAVEQFFVRLGRRPRAADEPAGELDDDPADLPEAPAIPT